MYILPVHLLHGHQLILYMRVRHRCELPVVFSTHFVENESIHRRDARQNTTFILL